MRSREPIALLVIGAALLAWSGIGPHDRTTWILEVAPIIIAVPCWRASMIGRLQKLQP